MKSLKNIKIFPLLTVGVLLCLLILIIFALSFLRNNTSLLNFAIDRNDIRENNENFGDPETEGGGDEAPTEFESKKLIVPSQFQKGAFADPKTLNLLPGFEISVYYAGLNAPRFFVISEFGGIFVTDIKAGKVNLLRDNDDDGVADENIVVQDDLRNPHGIDLYKSDLYIAEEHQVIVLRGITERGKFTKKEVLISNLPAGKLPGTGGHVTRTVKIGPDDKIYLTVGSSCNLCNEQDKRRASMVRYNLDGSGEEIFASGLRNTVGFTFAESSTDKFKIWSVDNGRDRIGDNLPPEEVNLIEKGKNYGWPYCYGSGNANPEYPEKATFCQNSTEDPAIEMQAHSAPLGIEILTSEAEAALPDYLANNLFIAFHGSWNRTVPVGYKVVRIDLSKSESSTLDFVTGWLQENGDAWGRPVGIGFDDNGVIYISDDKAGSIYKVEYKGID